MADVVVLGQVGRDLVLRVGALPEAGGSAAVSERREMLGGKGANQAVTLAQLGVPVALVGRTLTGRAATGSAAIGQDDPVRTVEEHQAVVGALLPELPEESVPLAAAHGRVLARDVTALVALPGFDNSAMDGYAARWAEVSAPSAMSSPAARRWLPAGGASRISTTSVPPSVSSTGTTTSAPEGSGAPVMIRCTVPGASGTMSVRPAGMSSATGSRTGSSSAPGGSGAPVMIRCTVPGASGTTSVRPAGMSSATGSVTGGADTSAQRAA